MGCPDNSFKYLSSEANARETLVKVGAIDNQDKIIDRNKFKEQAKRFLDYVKKEFNLDVASVITGRNLIAQFNKDVFSKIDKIRGYDKINKQTINNALNPVKEVIKPKEGVDFVFEQSPELAKIGSKEQYSQYLDTIFPDSKVKDIVYHGVVKGRDAYNNILEKGFDFKSKRNWDSPKSSFKEDDNTGMFFSDRATAQSYGINLTYRVNEKGEYEDIAYDNTIPAILNIKYLETSKLTSSGSAARFYRENKNKPLIGMYGLEGGSEGEHFNYVVFEPEQIHILGSKQDIEGFKKFMKNPIKSSVKYNVLNKTIEINDLADELGLEKDCK